MVGNRTISNANTHGRVAASASAEADAVRVELALESLSAALRNLADELDALAGTESNSAALARLAGRLGVDPVSGFSGVERRRGADRRRSDRGHPSQSLHLAGTENADVVALLNDAERQ